MPTLNHHGNTTKIISLSNNNQCRNMANDLHLRHLRDILIMRKWHWEPQEFKASFYCYLAQLFVYPSHFPPIFQCLLIPVSPWVSRLRDTAPLPDSCAVVCCGCVCSAATGMDSCCDSPDTAVFDFFPPDTVPFWLFFEGDVFTNRKIIITKKTIHVLAFLCIRCSYFNVTIKLTSRFFEDCTAHKLLETICVETRPVHRYSVLQLKTLDSEDKLTKCICKVNLHAMFDILYETYPIMQESFPRVLQLLYKPKHTKLSANKSFINRNQGKMFK